MKVIKTVLAHLSLVFCVTLLVPLFIEMFTRGAAMNFLASSLYQWMLFIGLLISAVNAGIQIYYRKKRK